MSNTEPKNNGSILFVDDEKNILTTLKHLFLSQGYTIYTASSGKEGLAILEEHPVDIVVSDMRMPQMDGATFLKNVADRWPNTKRLLMTGFTDLNSAILAINEGGIDFYISKPWKNDQITETIKKTMENKLLRDQNKKLQFELLKTNEELSILNSSLENIVQERTKELKSTYSALQNSYLSITEVLQSIVELHEGPLKGHSRNIAQHAKQLAVALNIPEKSIQNIYIAAMLHHLGKISLPTHDNRIPFVNLNKKQQLEFMQYPLLGSAALAGFSPLQEVAEIVLQHRERFDGSGFPNHLKADKISIGAQILAISVDFHELQAGLRYPEPMSADKAINYLYDHHRYYNPNILKVFVEQVLSHLTTTTLIPEIYVFPYELKPGMIISRDFTTKNGFMLMQKGQVCTEELVGQFEKLKFIHDLRVSVQAPPDQSAMKL